MDVFDMFGSVVYTGQIVNNIETLNIERTGVYIVCLRDNNNIIVSSFRKFIAN